MATLLLGVLLGCLQPAQSRYEQQLSEVDPGGSHAVHNERLRQLMRGLERLSSDRLPKAMDVQVERERRVEELVRIALAMAASAQEIRDALADVPLSEPERDDIGELADRLEERSLDLARRAPRLSLSEMTVALDQIEVTCDSCHARFRPVLPPERGF